MHRVLDILEQFESRHFSHRLSSDVMLPRAVAVSRHALLNTTEMPQTVVKSASTVPMSPDPTAHKLPLNVFRKYAAYDRSYTLCSIPVNDLQDQGTNGHGECDFGNESTDNLTSREVCGRRNLSRYLARANRNTGSRSAKMSKPKRKRIFKGTAEYREMRRIHQERYRQKQDQRAKDAAISVGKLRQDIPLLEMQRTRMAFSPELTLDGVVAEYFQLFRHGTLTAASDSQACHVKAKAQHQLVFLRTAMANNVLLGNRRGLDKLLGYVTKLSAKFNWAYATLSVTITDTTVAYVFPHLAKVNKLARVRSRLLGQRLALPYRVCFEWDEDTKRVTRLETMVDFLPPLLNVLGSLQDVVLVLEKAYITPDCVIGDAGKDDS